MKLNNFIFTIILSTFLLPSFSWAASVKKVKGKNVLIDTESSNIKTGALYYLVRGGKKKAIIKVLKTRPGQAIGKILKGNAQPGYTLVRRPSKKKSTSTARRSEPLPPLKTVENEPKRKSSKSYSSGGSFKDKLKIGGVITLGQDTAKVESSTGTSNGSGSSTSFELIADYDFSEKIKIRASIGQQAFSTEDTSVTIGPGGPPSRIDLGYINVDLWGKYHFKEMYWAGAGIGILLSPSYGGTTAVQEEELGSQMYLQVGGGVDYKLSDKFSIPAWIEYGTTLASGDATLSSIGLKLGLSMQL